MHQPEVCTMAHAKQVTRLHFQGTQSAERISMYIHCFSLILFQSPNLQERACNPPHNLSSIFHAISACLSGDLCHRIQTNTVSADGMGQLIAFSGLNVDICAQQTASSFLHQQYLNYLSLYAVLTNQYMNWEHTLVCFVQYL